jgi:hypothetical protein
LTKLATVTGVLPAWRISRMSPLLVLSLMFNGWVASLQNMGVHFAFSPRHWARANDKPQGAHFHIDAGTLMNYRIKQKRTITNVHPRTPGDRA